MNATAIVVMELCDFGVSNGPMPSSIIQRLISERLIFERHGRRVTAQKNGKASKV